MLLNSFKTNHHAQILVISGQVADVGIDLSTADAVILANQPWTKPDEDQIIARIRRPGMKANIPFVRLIAQDTIDQGIQSYIDHKYQLIKKIIYGGLLTDEQKQWLIDQEKQEKFDLNHSSIEISQEESNLSRHYL